MYSRSGKDLVEMFKENVGDYEEFLEHEIMDIIGLEGEELSSKGNLIQYY